MSRYSVSREKYPREIELRLTEEQYERAIAIAAFIGAIQPKRGPVPSMGIRYAIDFCYVTLLSQSSTDRTEGDIAP